MLNLQTAIRQMRVARRLGKLSAERQVRILRHNGGFNRLAQWERLMALRASIAKDVAPLLLAKRVAERDIFDIKHEITERRPTLMEVAVSVSAKLTKPKLTGPEYTPEWWEEAAKREKAAAKAERVMAKV